eukprot:4865324-Prymnesium_polylepis.3
MAGTCLTNDGDQRHVKWEPPAPAPPSSHICRRLHPLSLRCALWRPIAQRLGSGIPSPPTPRLACPEIEAESQREPQPSSSPPACVPETCTPTNRVRRDGGGAPAMGLRRVLAHVPLGLRPPRVPRPIRRAEYVEAAASQPPCPENFC